MNAWDDFWGWADTSQLGANVVGGLIVVLVAAVVGTMVTLLKASWRNQIWGPVGRAFRWVASIRLTTKTTMDSLRKPQSDFDSRFKAEQAKNRKRIAEIEVDHQIEVLKLNATLADKETSLVEEISEEMSKRTRESYDRGFADGAAEILAMPINIPNEATPPARPAPRPRWLLYRSPDSGDNRDFVLSNPVPRSIAFEVRLECSLNRFEFQDAAHWENLSGPQLGAFRGEIDDLGWARGLRFEIEWIDENGAQQMSSVVLPPAERDQN